MAASLSLLLLLFLIWSQIFPRRLTLIVQRLIKCSFRQRQDEKYWENVFKQVLRFFMFSLSFHLNWSVNVERLCRDLHFHYNNCVEQQPDQGCSKTMSRKLDERKHSYTFVSRLFPHSASGESWLLEERFKDKRLTVGILTLSSSEFFFTSRIHKFLLKFLEQHRIFCSIWNSKRELKGQIFRLYT